MSKDDLVEIGGIFHRELGTDETWARLYFDSETCNLVVIESWNNTTQYPRYAPCKVFGETRMPLSEFLTNAPSHREKVIELLMKTPD
jgi:hypothetical protein